MNQFSTSDDWICEVCSFSNSMIEDKCLVCGTMNVVAEATRYMETEELLFPAPVGELPEVEDLIQSTQRLRASSTAEPLKLDAFVCLLTKVTFRDPVVAADGVTYEKAAIQGHIDAGGTHSPSTGEELEHTFLIKNKAVSQALEELKRKTKKKKKRAPNRQFF